MQVTGLRSERKTLNSSRSKQDRENIIIESKRKNYKEHRKTQQDHHGPRSSFMSHHNVVHKTIPTPTAMNIIEAKAALDEEWTKLQKLPAGWVQIDQSSRGDTKSKNWKATQFMFQHSWTCVISRILNWRFNSKNTKHERH